MKPLLSSKTGNSECICERNARFSTLDGQAYRFVIVGMLFLVLGVHDLRAQVGSNNPTGVSGIFNGNITTGCSYDPYTGNATRSITDIAVAGAVGQYPLALVRTYNSRIGVGGAARFGVAGQWTHNYSWVIETSAPQSHPFTPGSYTVDYPDGRKVIFAYAAGDPYYRGPLGVRERFQTPPAGGGLGYLILPDGGKVEFDCEELDSGPDGNEVWWWTFTATAIIDPYGMRTTLGYNGDGTLSQVTEPAGRYIQFIYSSFSGLITSVAASDGRSVRYNYTTISPGGQAYSALTSVVYYGISNWTATYTYQAPNVSPATGIPLLRTCDDPMYPGPMHRIAYTYRTADNYTGNHAVYGQISSENYYDGTNVGTAVSTLTVPSATARTETRPDSKTRSFTYNTSGYLTSCTDFMNHSASQGYDGNKWINSVTDRNNHTTNYTHEPFTGNVTQVQFPAAADVTPSPGTRGTLNYTYGSASCADTNNRDSNNPYYVCTSTDEGGHVTQFWRDANKRVTRIDYPDGGYETFVYDPAHFYQLSSHRMLAGGTESFTYDARGLKLTYRNPDNASGNPTARYLYDQYDRVSDITDVFGTTSGDGHHTTSFSYNLRGQLGVTTLPMDPVDSTRHTLINYYNDDGTVRSQEDQLYQSTQYTYDDYRRLRSVTPPARGWNDNGSYTTHYYYDTNGSGEDYRYTDSSVTYVTLPSGKQTKTVYDDNRRAQTVTVGFGTGDDATTSYGYDNAGNLTTVTYPLGHDNTTTNYDERNRPSSISILSHTTSFMYDTAGRKKKITRPNGQVITYDSFDQMNRVLQQTAKNSATQNAITKYTYTQAGLLDTMQDPHLVAINSTDNYNYGYDTMGRKTSVSYPAEADGTTHRAEYFHYDTGGRLDTYTNRANRHQSFSYDALNRMTGFTWDDGVTPSVAFGYDVASNLTSINNANANITRGYFFDKRLRFETESILLTGGSSKTVNYTYDADGNRANITYPAPESYGFGYTYTGRNQLAAVNNWATYVYDTRGNLTFRTLLANNTPASDYTYDAYDRLTWMHHYLNGTTRTFNYGYDSMSNDRTYARRIWGGSDIGEAFSYDLADQAIAVQVNVATPQNLQQPLSQNIIYDANGNRVWFTPPGSNNQYVTDNLNQYTSINSASVTYRADANLATYNGATYNYDAQSRLTTAAANTSTVTFAYDGLNRQVSRTVNGGQPIFSVWDGWDLIEEYQAANQGATTALYLYGASGLIAGTSNGQVVYFYQDGSGSTSHLADGTGNLLEWYRYDLQGTPVFYNGSDQQISASAFGVRHLFTGQQWYSDISLYDLRNRFYSPDLGRFLQPDPIGFKGDPTNLYRYCGNNPVTSSDPLGTDVAFFSSGMHGWVGITNPNAMPNNMTYFEFGPQDSTIGSLILGLTGGLVGPGQWAVHNANYGGFNYLTIPTTPEEDSRLLAAFGDRVANQGDLYSVYMNNCYTAPLDVIANALYSDDQNDASPPVYHFNYVTSDAPNDGMVDNAPPVTVDTAPVVVSAPPVTTNEQAKFKGLLRLAMSYNPYWGYLPTTFTTNWAGGIAGLPGGGSPWDLNNQLGGLDPIAGFPGIYDGNPVGAMESLGCFVAGTPVLMADGREKPIESVQVGEAVLAWNEETNTIFSTTVIHALHHEEKMQTLCDIELEDGRKLIANNDHPIYVMEDDAFIFTRELAARFAKGEPITFRDNSGRPVRVASLRMWKQTCKVYNLHVEGQGKAGHTYYANGILVHNLGARTGLK